MKSDEALRIPKLSIKSSFFVLFSLVIGGIVIPYVLTLVGMSFRMATILVLPVSFAFSLVYSHYCIETKQGYNQRFFIAWGLTTIVFTIVAYVWLMQGFIF
ncbi:hypothetical protein IV487_03540 [Enterococcus saccharolyticus]|uniref:Uncharacterized protein n=1 Tax=Candidatus Enterococcus willemsii TaxID=1857215 RepID=A0ABQ6YYF1_9ENTE|nr:MULTISPECIES: hypothetical protein [Enterococcus]KAF1303108.1 hypothetical protein BAU17_08235 [Enterococcus sp. CU12B]MCD5001542.1 hypothetical protein [Enterococcus saccharolyticus]